MYYELLQQRYGVGINKQAGLGQEILQRVGQGIKAIGRIGGKASNQAATRMGKHLNMNAADFRSYIDDVAAKGSAARSKYSNGLLNKFNKQRDAIAYRLGQKRLLGAGAVGATGLAGYGAYNMLSGDDAGDTATSNQVQTPNMSDAQLMAQNGWNGWDWNDLGGSLANYISSGKIAEHAIPAILAYMAGRAMS